MKKFLGLTLLTAFISVLSLHNVNAENERPVLTWCENSNGTVVAYGADCESGGNGCVANDCPKGTTKAIQ